MRILAWPESSPVNANPYISLLYNPIRDMGHDIIGFENPWIARQYNVDIVHIHWLEQVFWNSSKTLKHTFLASIAFLRTIDQFRRHGVKIAWTIHNLKPHDGSWHCRMAWPVLLSQYLQRVDIAIAMTAAARDIALTHFAPLRNKPTVVIPHGHYRTAYPNVVSSVQARHRLGLPADAVVLLFFGMIRPYKNVPRLIETFKKLSDTRTFLLIAGPLRDGDLGREIAQATEGQASVRLTTEAVPTEDVQIYMNAADLVVLPFEDILNSGSAMLALSFDRPVLVPGRGSLPELRKAVGAEWVRTYDGAFDECVLADALASLARSRPQGPAPLDAYDWRTIADKTVRAYQAVANGS